MKEFQEPVFEVVEFDENDVIHTSTCSNYECPNAYGGTCTGNPYG
jgi:hypothetical protein